MIWLHQEFYEWVRCYDSWTCVLSVAVDIVSYSLAAVYKWANWWLGWEVDVIWGPLSLMIPSKPFISSTQPQT